MGQRQYLLEEKLAAVMPAVRQVDQTWAEQLHFFAPHSIGGLLSVRSP